ncbi:VENN motif pre-toxin domain-containing protein, partial [Pectobacterium parmentieri]
TVTTLSLLAGGLAAGTVGDSTTNAVAGAQASQNAVENNYLSSDMYALNRKVKAAKEKGEDIAPILEEAREQAEKDREKQAASCHDRPDMCAFGRDVANDAYSSYLENGFLQGIDSDVARFVQQETAKDNAVIDRYASEFGKGLAVASEGAALLAGAGISLILPGGKGGPVNIATGFNKSPQSIWGRSTNEIVKDFQSAGYQVNVRQSTRGSGQAVIIEVKGHPEISQIQYHPGGGRHGGSYYKISTTTQGTVKVVDPSTYNPTQGEKATIIDKPKK